MSDHARPAPETMDLVERYRRYQAWHEAPEFQPCPRCQGKGYHHGFGEHGHDPDWCLSCGGPGEAPTEPGTWSADDLLAEAMAELSALREARDRLTDEVRELKERLAFWKQANDDVNDSWQADRERADQAEREGQRLRGIAERLAQIELCEDAPDKCYLDSGPYCGSHGFDNPDELIKEARTLIADQKGDQ